MTAFDVGITTLTNVTAISRIAYDIRDINSFLSAATPNFLDAKRVYDNGANSPQYDQNGNEMEELLSLKRMGDAATEGSLNEDPTFIFQMLGMMDVGQSIDDALLENSGYVNEYIAEKLNDESSGRLAAQASAVLNVQMYAVHQLWDGLLDCVEISNGFNPAADHTGSINPKQSFDNFIALYVGAGQEGAPDFNGDMLYDLAHQAAKRFGTISDVGEAKVNEDIRNYYLSIQQLMSEENYCQREDALQQLWSLVNRIVAKMHVPLVQMLIHHMNEGEMDQVEMYAMALIPQLSQCRPSTHRKLKSYLLVRSFNRKDFSRIVSLLQESYDCLGFTCDDVGAYDNDVVALCAGYEATHPMAGFIPIEHVRSVSKLDLDVLAIGQLLEFPSKTGNAAAQQFYRFGRSATLDEDRLNYNTLSLREMTQATHRKKYSPYHQDIVDYHNNENYADLQIMNGFGDGTMAIDQRRVHILSWVQYGVIPEYMMAVLAISHTECGNTGIDIDARERTLQTSIKSPAFFWDAFAAFYIGSLEGVDLGGSDEIIDGVMLWNLANKRAATFNTLNDEFYAEINDEMIYILYSGQSELDRNNCLNIEKSANEAMHLMLMPIIQNNIWYAIKNQDLKANSTSSDLIIGKALALSILPIVKKYDEDAAMVIERNMVDIENKKPVPDGAEAVAYAFFQILDDVGWGCKFLGETEGIGACQAQVKSSSAPTVFSSLTVVAITLSFSSIMSLGSLQ